MLGKEVVLSDAWMRARLRVRCFWSAWPLQELVVTHCHSTAVPSSVPAGVPGASLPSVTLNFTAVDLYSKLITLLVKVRRTSLVVSVLTHWEVQTDTHCGIHHIACQGTQYLYSRLATLLLKVHRT